jgi:hypothetical protein
MQSVSGLGLEATTSAKRTKGLIARRRTAQGIVKRNDTAWDWLKHHDGGSGGCS